MTVEIVPFQDKYSDYFYDLNYDWLNEYFYVEDYDEKVLRNCKEEIIDKGGHIFFAIFKSNPNPASHAKCLISFKIWKLKVQQSPTTTNFPKKLLKKLLII